MPPIKTKQTTKQTIYKWKLNHCLQNRLGSHTRRRCLNNIHAKTVSIFHHKSKFDPRMVLWTRFQHVLWNSRWIPHTRWEDTLPTVPWPRWRSSLTNDKNDNSTTHLHFILERTLLIMLYQSCQLKKLMLHQKKMSLYLSASCSSSGFFSGSNKQLSNTL